MPFKLCKVPAVVGIEKMQAIGITKDFGRYFKAFD
jgi:hypothetical protein